MSRGLRAAGAPAPATIILGSARSHGNTRLLADAVLEYLPGARLFDLNDYRIGPYVYDGAHDTDDFLPLAREMARSEAIIFASPVYWYSMSGPMKIFFDRLTDLTDVAKPVGKSLGGKTAYLLATSGKHEAPDCFEAPFALTAGYFRMGWGGMLHARFAEDGVLSNEARAEATAFAAAIHARLTPVPLSAS